MVSAAGVLFGSVFRKASKMQTLKKKGCLFRVVSYHEICRLPQNL